MTILTPVSGEFVVDTQIVGDQAGARVTGLPNGGYVITWTDMGSGTLGDSSKSGIKAQIYDATGIKVGGEFLVNSNTNSFQFGPSVAPLSTGGFIISWTDQSGSLGDADNTSVKAQIFASDGSKVGSEFIVNNQTVNGQDYPNIVGLSNGGFVIAWLDFSGTLGDTDGTSIKAQIYDAAGYKIGSEFLVNTQTVNNQQFPSITSLANGNFVICWEDLFWAQGSVNQTKAQIFSPDGAKIGSEFPIDTGQGYPKLTTLSNGNFVASWTDYSTDTYDYANISIQLFDPNGEKIGSEKTVNSITRGYQNSASISSLPTGGFVVVWQDEGPTFTSPFSLKAQIFNSDGSKLGSEFQVGTSQQYDTSISLQPAVSGLNDGGFVISWTGWSGGFGDGNGWGVNAQRFTLVLDSQTGGTANEWIIGGRDDDTLSGGGANDNIDGDAGNDVAVYSGNLVDYALNQLSPAIYQVVDNRPGSPDGTDVVVNIETLRFADQDIPSSLLAGLVIDGTSGPNTLSGGQYGDLLRGFDGDDVLAGVGGNDTIIGGQGNDKITGGIGLDTVSYEGAWGPVKVSLAIVGKPQFAGLDTGSDTFVDLIENLTGAAYDDTLTGNALNNVIIGLDGNDRVNGAAGADTMIGGNGNDIYTVDNAGDVIIEYTLGGTDNVNSSVSYSLSAEVENLTLTGSANIDGTGNVLNNQLKGNTGANTLTGGAGNDRIDGGAGADILIGGTGNDTYTVDNIGDQIIENAGEGTDLVKASVDFTMSANIEKLTQTGSANINGTGSDLANTITGNAGSNILSGGLGNDVLSAGAGNDTLNGGAGADKLTGGVGNDTFLFDVIQTAANKDTITDFVTGQDHIALTRSAFTAFAGDPAGALNPAEFAIGTAATTSSQHLIYNSGTGALYYDADGVGGAAQVQIAVLSGHPSLSVGDIFLI